MDQRPSLLDTFLERFENQLFKSVYLNGFPTVPDLLDICTIDQHERQLAEKWVQQILLNGVLNADVTAHPSALFDLRHLYFEGKSREANFGERDLAFGYPFILLKNQENPFVPKAAPVLIWSLQMEASPNRTDNWHFLFRKGQNVRLNPFLGTYLPEVFDPETLDRLEKACQEYRLSLVFQPITDLLLKIGEEKKLEYEAPEGWVIPFPNNNQANILAEKGTLLWSGLLGLFPSINPNLLEFYMETREKEEKELTLPDEPDSDTTSNQAPIHPFGLFPQDNDQVGINRSAFQCEVAYVDGKPGSGKTQSLCNLISNALSNGKKCLVVSERVHVLKDIQARLIEKKLGGLTFLFQDIHQDTALFLEHTRRSIENLRNNPGFSAESFELTLGKCSRAWQKLDQAFQAANGNIFGNYSWTETVGKFLRSNKVEGKELLSSQLNPGDFVFTFSEYEMLREAIELSRPLFEKLNTLKHPLTELHPEVFLYKDSRESREWIEKKLKKFLKKTNELQYRYIRKLDAYAQKLTEHYENHYRDLKQSLIEIRENIEDFRNRFGPGFEDAGMVASGKLHFYGVFSQKHKEILQAKEDISEHYQELKKTFQEREYFDYRFPAGGETRHLKRIRQSLDDFEKTLEHWYQKLPGSIQEELHRLNSKTVHVDLDYFEQIKELEYALDVLLEELNNSNLFHTSFASNRLTITKRQQYIESIMEKLEYIQYNLRDFEAFYDWQKNWLSLGDISQKLIRALVKVKPDNWMAAFESWYFHNRLTLDYHSELPHEDGLLEEFVKSYYLLRDQLPAQILDLWQKKLTLSSRALKRQAKSAYACFFGKNNLKSAEEMPLTALFHDFMPTVTDAAPVLLATPYAALDLLLPAKEENRLDFLLIDEADSLELGLILPILQMADHSIAFGKSTPFDLPQHESLLDYAMQVSGKKIELKNQHLDLPEDLQQFIQATFDDQSSRHPHGRKRIESPSLKTFPLEGRYDENLGNNDVEAQKIVDLLNQVPKTPQQTFPRVIIACMTQEQRNLILDYLLKIKQHRSNGSDRIRQMERNGLRVLAVDELQGHRADILILSATYGSINLKQELTGDIFWLNTPEGLSSLHHLFSCATGESWICHSIPDPYLEKLSDDWENLGTALFSIYLRYAEASQLKNPVECSRLLELIKQERQLPIEKRKTSVFLEEVAEALKPYFEEGRILLDQQLDELPLPLVIRAAFEDEPDVLLLADGFLFKGSLGAYLWEETTRKKLIENGFQLISTWSSQWWKNPMQEARKIASVIIKLDNKSRSKEPAEEKESLLESQKDEK